MTNGKLDQPGQPPSRGGEPATAATLGGDGKGYPAPRAFVHDMRNLLAPIHNAVQLLRLRSASDANLLQVADMIDRQIKGIGRMLDEFGNAAQTAMGTSAPGTPDAYSAPHVAAKAPQGKRILIADDNQSLRVSLSNILEEMGYEVKAAADGAEALKVARDWAPAFVLLDIHMPKFDGFEVARQLRGQFPSATMKLVMMSGDTLSEVSVRAAKQAGFDHCVDKVDALGLLQQLFEGNA